MPAPTSLLGSLRQYPRRAGTTKTKSAQVPAPPLNIKPETEHTLVVKDLEKEVRNEALLAHKAVGRSIREIAKLFEVSPSTAHRWMKEAEQSEKLMRARGIVGERLVPKALAVYDAKLQEGDLEAARDILFGAGVLSKSQKIEVSRQEDPLEAFRQKFFKREEPVVEVERIDESE